MGRLCSSLARICRATENSYSFVQVVIRYAFNATIDDNRKDAFRNAVTMWRVLQQHRRRLLDGACGSFSIWDCFLSSAGSQTSQNKRHKGTSFAKDLAGANSRALTGTWPSAEETTCVNFIEEETPARPRVLSFRAFPAALRATRLGGPMS